MMRAMGFVLALMLPWPLASLRAQTPPSPPPAASPAPTPEAAEPGTPTYGLALYDEPELPSDFKSFPYVNPNAPKGGEVVLGALGSFDSFNLYIVRGSPAAEVSRIYDTLMRRNQDEASGAYGHLAKSITVAPDHLSVTFELRPEAKFHDGTPVTASDVAWTFNTLRKSGRPFFQQYYADVKDATVEDQRHIVFHFSNAHNRELPLDLGELAILPEHWWKGRDFATPLNDAPLGSGPYRLDHFDFGRTTVLQRVPDYWAKDLPTAKGLANFDTIRTEYYRDAGVQFEAFKSGRIDFRQDNIAKNWATGYDFPALQKGLVKREVFRHHLPTGMQGFAINTRRPMFKDPRVRQALDAVFDFQWMNKNLFFDQYVRTESYFSNSDDASSGIPEGDELTLLNKYRDKLPPELFTTPFKLPVTDGSGNNREGLRSALNLFKAAGWEVKDRKLVDPNGHQMSFEILSEDPSFERVETPYVQWLSRLGIDAHIRNVDPAQYQHLIDSFDFDMTMLVIPESDYPGNEQRDDWSCAAAKTEGSNNITGVCDPVVDSLIDKIIAADERSELVTGVRALDRVLLWGWYSVPNWHSQDFKVAYWNRFAHPAQPVRSGYVFDSWWVDPALAAKTDAQR